MAVISTSLAYDPAELRADREREFNPIRQLSPAVLSTQLEEFRAGRLCDLARSMDVIEERDAMIHTAAGKAKNAVARHGFEIKTAKCRTANERKLAKRQAAFLETFFREIVAKDAAEPDLMGAFSLLVRQMMDGKGKRYAVHNIEWRPLGGGELSATFHKLPLWFFENRSGPLRLLPSPGHAYGKPLNPSDWLISIGRGVMIPSSVLWLYKNLSFKDWVIFSQRYGFPVAVGTTDAKPGTAEHEQMKSALRSLGGGDSVVTADGDRIEWQSIGQSAASLPFAKLVDYCDRTNVILWRGADLGTISQGGDGVGASLQGEETATIEKDDAAWIEETLNLRVVRTALEWRFGHDTKTLATIEVKVAERKDEQVRRESFGKAIENGFPVTVGAYSREFNIPLPDDADPSAIMEAPIVRQMEAAAEVNDDGKSDAADDDQVGNDDDERFEDPPPEPMSNNAIPRAQPDLVAALAEEAFGLRAENFEPVRELIEDLAQRATDGSLDDSDFERFVGEMVDELPDLFGALPHDELTEIFERGLGTSAARGAALAVVGPERGKLLKTIT